MDIYNTYIRAMCSEISAQNWGTREIRALRACCFTRGSCSTSNASTPAADDCGRGTIEKEYQVNARLESLDPVVARDASPRKSHEQDDISSVNSGAASNRISHPPALLRCLRRNMSLIARGTRTATRTIPRTRLYSIVVDAPSSEWVAKREAIKHHAAGT